MRWKHLIFIELFGMDENGFGALILLIPKKCDWVRKLTPIHRHTFCELFSPAAHIAPARLQGRIPRFSRLPYPQKITKNSLIFAIFLGFFVFNSSFHVYRFWASKASILLHLVFLALHIYRIFSLKVTRMRYGLRTFFSIYQKAKIYLLQTIRLYFIVY